MERRLIGENAGKKCLSVDLILDLQPREPVGPLAGKVSIDADFAVD